MTPKPQPPTDGLYWLKDADGEWRPLLVQDGEMMRLSTYFEENADGVHTLARLTDCAPTLRGPLVRPR